MRLSPLILIPLAVSVSGYCAPGCKPASGGGLASSNAPVSPKVIDRYVSDPALNRSWAVVVDCSHPGWPPHLIEVQYAGEGTTSTPTNPGMNPPNEPAPRAVIPAIQSGSRVELWSDGAPRIRLSGIALESAPVGKSIHVRAGLGLIPLRGIVRGPHSVELEANKAVRSEP